MCGCGWSTRGDGTVQRRLFGVRTLGQNIPMKRSQFLKSAGAAFVIPAVWPWAASAQSERSNCVLVPSETPGPFPLDLTENIFFFRQDIREDRVGVPLRQKIRIVGAENCDPMPNVRVNIWHCDRDGDYSGYAAMGSEGQTYCRGYQMTDANGECEFVTIFPGWYPGRTTHVHFQVHVSSQYSVVSQWTWPHAAAVEVATTHAALYPEGPDPLPPSQDGVFIDGFQLQLADLTWDDAAQEYVSHYEATVEGAGVSGVGYQELVNSSHLDLGQNFPNPVARTTQVPFELKTGGEVVWTLWSPSGVCVVRKDLGMCAQGRVVLDVDFDALGVPAASYLYQVEVFNASGRFSDVKRMTLLK